MFIGLTRSSPQGGFTLTEMAIVLGIVGTVLGGIWAAAGTVNQSQKINKAHQQIMTIVQNVQTAYATRHSFAQTAYTDITGALINAGITPADMVNPANAQKLVNPWGGGVIISSWSKAGGATNVNFGIEYDGIPATACHKIFAMLIPVAASINLVKIEDGSNNWIDPTTNPDPSALTCNSPGNIATEWMLNQ